MLYTYYWYMLQHRWTRKHYAKWKKPVTKDHILYEMSKIGKSMRTVSRLDKSIETNSRDGCGVWGQTEVFWGQWQCSHLRLWWWLHKFEYAKIQWLVKNSNNLFWNRILKMCRLSCLVFFLWKKSVITDFLMI